MKDRLTETIYEGEHYMIPYSEMSSWFAYIKDLSVFEKNCGNLEIEFWDKFKKYKIKTSKKTIKPLYNLQCTLALDSRDWGQNKRDAWIYGIVCGWENEEPLEGETEDDAVDEICEKYGFDKKHLKQLRKNFLKLKTYEDEIF